MKKLTLLLSLALSPLMLIADHHGSTTANLGATTPRLRAGWTGMLDGTN